MCVRGVTGGPTTSPRALGCGATRNTPTRACSVPRPRQTGTTLAAASAAGVPVAGGAKDAWVDTHQRPAVPRSIYDIDNGRVLGYSQSLAEGHPGFHDNAYKRRRMMLAQAAKAHRFGTPIPTIEYTEAERSVWASVLRELHPLHAAHACREYLTALPKFGFREDAVPQLQAMSDVLGDCTGWAIRPVAGLMHPRDFLAGLAFKTFHSTQYIRHVSQPGYTPEPDVVHELIGHVPLLANPEYAAMVEAIGRASLGADDKTIQHLTKVYWYSVEFGVLREGDDVKAFGAGILSSVSELRHMASGRAELSPLDPRERLPKMSYKDGVQARFFVLPGFEAGRQQLMDYADALCSSAAGGAALSGPSGAALGSR